MPKVNIRGLDKNAIVRNVFVQLNAKDPNIDVPSAEGMRSIAKIAWDLDCNDSSEIFDDTKLVEMHDVAGLLQTIVDQIRVEKAQENMRMQYAKAAQSVAASGNRLERKYQLDIPAVAAAAAPAKDLQAIENAARLARQRLYAEEGAKWEARRQAAKAATLEPRGRAEDDAKPAAVLLSKSSEISHLSQTVVGVTGEQERLAQDGSKMVGIKRQ